MKCHDYTTASEWTTKNTEQTISSLPFLYKTKTCLILKQVTSGLSMQTEHLQTPALCCLHCHTHHHISLNTQPDTYPMHECLRVEKLPCIFLEKRESLFIILLAGSKKEFSWVQRSMKTAALESEGETKWTSVTRPKHSMLYWIGKESCPNSFYVLCCHKLWHWETGPFDRTVEKKQFQEQQMQNRVEMQNKETQDSSTAPGRTVSQAC